MAEMGQMPRNPFVQSKKQRQKGLVGRDPNLLAELGEASIGGLGAIGNALDLPGSMVRDALSMKNPVDQLLTPFSAKNRTTGRDLARNMGFLAPNAPDTFTNFWTVEMPVTIATDPLSYLTFGGSGALSAGGKVASKVGLMKNLGKVAGKGVGKRAARMTHTLDDLLRATPEMTSAAEDAARAAGTTLDAIRGEKLGGLMGAQLPFTGMSAPIGKGAKALGVAKVLDTVGAAVKASAPARFGRMLFDPSAMGKLGKLEQEVAGLAYDNLPEGEIAARLSHHEAIGRMNQLDADFAEAFGKDIAGPATEGGTTASRNLLDSVVRMTAERSGNVDEALESLTDADKLLLRMGEENLLQLQSAVLQLKNSLNL